MCACVSSLLRACSSSGAVECEAGWRRGGGDDDDGATTITIPEALVNDGYCDCPRDGLDEPATGACAGSNRWAGVGRADSSSSDAFACPGDDPAVAVPSSRYDDGVCDCCDGADEPSGDCEDGCAAIAEARRRRAEERRAKFERGAERRRAATEAFAVFQEEVRAAAAALETAEIPRLERRRADAEEERAAAQRTWDDERRAALRRLVEAPSSAPSLPLGLDDDERRSFVKALCRLVGERDGKDGCEPLDQALTYVRVDDDDDDNDAEEEIEEEEPPLSRARLRERAERALSRINALLGTDDDDEDDDEEEDLDDDDHYDDDEEDEAGYEESRTKLRDGPEEETPDDDRTTKDDDNTVDPLLLRRTKKELDDLLASLRRGDAAARHARVVLEALVACPDDLVVAVLHASRVDAGDAADALAEIVGANDDDVESPSAECAADDDDLWAGHRVPSPRADDDPLATLFRPLDDVARSYDPAPTTDALAALDAELERARKRLEEAIDDDDGRRDANDLKYGPDGVLHALAGECFRGDAGKYEYEVCVRGKATQKESGGSSTHLGRYDGYDASPRGALTLRFVNGARCYNGPKRSATVRLVCGETEGVVVNVEEPETCRYEMILQTFAACDEAFAKRYGLL